jgi:hypothetical protein
LAVSQLRVLPADAIDSERFLLAAGVSEQLGGTRQ